MRILALDSSGLVASVAIMQDDTLLGEYTTNHKKTHSQTLLPMLAQLMEELKLEMSDLDAIAVAGGPGSFTGLRIGSATAKGLGLAADLPLIHVPTLEGLAYNLWGTDAYVCPLMDARRNQVYTGVYYYEKDDPKKGNGGMKMCTKIEQCAVGIDEIIAKLNLICESAEDDMQEATCARGKKVIFLGDGVPVFSNYIKANCQMPFSFAPAHMNRQSAASVAALGMVYAKEGRMESADEHKPDYLRLSQAERERLAQGKSIEPEAE